MTITKLYTDVNGESCFEEIPITLNNHGDIGHLSEEIKVSSLQFRENKPNYNWDFHNAPDRQFIVLLDGGVEITTSLGEKRIFNTGDVLLLEDTSGKGHQSKNITN